MSDVSPTTPTLDEVIRKDIEEGGVWSQPHPVSRSSDEAVSSLGAALALSAMQIKVGTAGSVGDRARLVAGELELMGYYLAPLGEAPRE